MQNHLIGRHYIGWRYPLYFSAFLKDAGQIEIHLIFEAVDHLAKMFLIFA